MSKNQKGFTALEVVLVIVVLVLAGAGAWYVWSKNKDDKKDTTSQAAQKADNKEVVAEETPADEQKYLNIDEWDVRFKLDSANEDAYYFIPNDKPNYAYLSLNSLKNVDNCSATDTTLGVYVRFIANEVDPNTENELYIDRYPNAKKVGNYYFYFQSPQAFCSEEPSVQAKAEAARKAFSANADSAEEIPGN